MQTVYYQHTNHFAQFRLIICTLEATTFQGTQTT